MKRDNQDKTIKLACDFETTVYDGQTETEVWSSAYVEIGDTSEHVYIDHSITDTFEKFTEWCANGYSIIGYYHNLKFDGYFWTDYLLRKGFVYNEDREQELKEKEFRCVISDMGEWYRLEFACGGKSVVLLDSLKLIPYSLKVAGQSFGTKHQKLEMEYKGRRFAGCSISEKEKRYIENDVLVLKECLEFMFSLGHDKLTIASCCLAEFKNLYGFYSYREDFPDLTKIELLPNFGAKNADEYIRKSYHGGWCYVVPEKTNRVYKDGVTADVNSLYPSMMSSESGNVYPVGKPTFWSGNFIPEKATRKNHYYFVRVKCSFRIKDGYLPFIQIKGNPFYKSTEMLTSSELTFKGTKYKEIYVEDKIFTDEVTLTFTQTDYKLFHDHYNVYNEVILDGCYFWNDVGIFDMYIDKYRKLKIKAQEDGNKPMKAISKLFLNSLYGKMSASDDSSHQIPFLDSNSDIVKFIVKREHNKKPGYIAVGSAITSYARNFTIRSAQKNYYGENSKYGFIYADTDSIHCALKPLQKNLNGVKVHPSHFCCWKLESKWDKGIFIRQKTYIEHVTHEDGIPVEELKNKDGTPKKPYNNIKCAGMPQTCKNKLDEMMETGKMNITDFKQGLKVDGKLMPKRIHGGMILVDTTYELK